MITTARELLARARAARDKLASGSIVKLHTEAAAMDHKLKSDASAELEERRRVIRYLSANADKPIADLARGIAREEHWHGAFR